MAIKKNYTLDDSILLSREKIRSQMAEYLKRYLGTDLDLNQTTYLGYLIDVMSTMYANEVFLSSLNLQESILDTATIPEAIYMLARYIGYEPGRATPASGTLTFQIDLNRLPQEFDLFIDKDMKFYSGDIPFSILIGDIEVRRTASGVITVKLDTSRTTLEGKIDLPKSLSDDGVLFFNIGVIQVDYLTKKYKAPFDLEPLEIYYIRDTISENDGQIYDLRVFVDGEEWTKVISSSTPPFNSKAYTYSIMDRSFTIKFAKHPDPGSDVEVLITKTYGSLGNVANNTIISGDQLRYTLSNGETIIVPYKIFNMYSFTNGADYESPELVKINAKKSFVGFNRLTSQEDFKNISVIVPELKVFDTYTIMKRSDLKSNEVVMYNIYEINDEIIPTRTDNILNADEYRIKPYSIYNLDGEDYYVPFQLDLDDTINQVSYTYINRKSQIAPTPKYNGEPTQRIQITNINIDSDFDTDMFSITIHTMKDEDFDTSGYSITLDLHIQGFSYDERLTLNHTQDDNINGRFTFAIPISTFPKNDTMWTLRFLNNTLGLLINEYQVQIALKNALDNLIYSNCEVISETPLDYIIYDVPFILKSWYDTLTEEEKIMFEESIISILSSPEYIKNKAMINIAVGYKFGNTRGTLKNIYYNQPDIIVKKFVASKNDVPTNAAIGDKFAINSPINDPTDPFYMREGWIYTVRHVDPNTGEPLFTNDSFNEEPVSTLLYNEEIDDKYFYNGDYWVQPSFSLPIKIHAVLYTQDGDVSIIETAKQMLMEKFGKVGFDADLIRSELIKELQSLDRVMSVKLLKPEIDIYYKYNLEDLTTEQLLHYTPEYIYLEEDSIQIDIIKY